MSYYVYQLINNKTGAVYVGMTGRTLEKRKAEHMACTSGTRVIAEAVVETPDPDDWTISPLWQTQVYPEAREMEKAFIVQMSITYVCLNTDIPNFTEPLANNVAHRILTGHTVSVFPWDWYEHEDYPGVIVYKRYNDKTWKYGYRGRGESDHTGLWKEFLTDDTMFDDAHFTAAKYFEDYNVELFEQEYLCDFTESPTTTVCKVGMTEQQNYLMIFQEELGELVMEMLNLQQTISKAVRFGLHEQWEGYKVNHDRIRDELNDLLGSITKLAQYGFDLKLDIEKINAKMEKIDKFTDYPKDLGIIL